MNHQMRLSRVPDWASVLIITLLCFLQLFCFFPISNEMDVLADAKHFFNPNWIPNDWYLDQSVTYRLLFNYVVGWGIEQFGILNMVLFGRGLTYFLFAVCFHQLFKIFKIPLFIGLGILVYFLSNQAVAAQEWMLGGLETKPFAYAFALLGSIYMYKQKYFLSFLFVGLALSFHVLVGIFSIYCLLIAIAFNHSTYLSVWKIMLKRSWIFLITGIWGLVGIAQYIFERNSATNNGWGVYVLKRVPHHAIPNWDVGTWVVILALVLIQIAFLVWYSSKSVRFFSVYTLASLDFFFIGLFIHWFGSVEWLRFYWFRFGDTVLPFFTFLLVGSFLSEKISTLLTHSGRNQFLEKKAFSWVYVLCCLLLVVLPKLENAQALLTPSNYDQDKFLEKKVFDVEVAGFITKNTPKTSTFIIPPGISDFYFSCERAVLVSFKHSPQKAGYISDWFDRLTHLNNDKVISKSGFEILKEINEGYSQLSEEKLSKLNEKYGCNYFLTYSSVSLNFPLLYETKKYKLYLIE